MIAAIYAARARIRGSCTSCAAAKGWTVAEEHVCRRRDLGCGVPPLTSARYFKGSSCPRSASGASRFRPPMPSSRSWTRNVAGEWITVEVPALHMTHPLREPGTVHQAGDAPSP
jgi:hypothetical protein